MNRPLRILISIGIVIGMLLPAMQVVSATPPESCVFNLDKVDDGLGGYYVAFNALDQGINNVHFAHVDHISEANPGWLSRHTDIWVRVSDGLEDSLNPQIAVDPVSEICYISWLTKSDDRSEDNMEIMYVGSDDNVNWSKPQNGGIIDVPAKNVNYDLLANDYSLTLTFNKAPPITLQPDIDGDKMPDSVDDGHIWSIFVGGQEETSNVANRALNEIPRQIYNTLLGREYILKSGKYTTHQKEDMYLMTHDINDDVDDNGFADDVDMIITKDHLRQAISGESRNAWLLEDVGDGYRVDDDDIVFIYLSSHGGKNPASPLGSILHINPGDNVNSSEICDWLDILESKTNLATICFVIEACHSGGFIGLSEDGGISQSNTGNTDRIVITSTIRDTPAGMYQDFADDNVSLNGAFSASFINEIDQGHSIAEAFNTAEAVSEGYRSMITYYAITYNHVHLPYLPQNPKLDDNGDGLGSNGYQLGTNQYEDGYNAYNLHLTYPERRIPDSSSSFITYDEMSRTLEDMARKHPYLCQLESIGTSVQGRDIWALKLSDNPEIEQDEMEILISGAIHGDEQMGAEFCMAYIQDIMDNYFLDPELMRFVDSREIYIIPILNPDGYVADTRGNANGEDLNRDFWYPDCPDTDPYFSQPETIALSNFVENHDFSVSLVLHGYVSEGWVLYPYHYTNDPTGDEDVFIKTANDLANILDAGYVGNVLGANGNTDDWLYNNHSCIALSTEIKSDSFSDFDWQWEQYQEAFDYLIELSSVRFINLEDEQIISGDFMIEWETNENMLRTGDDYIITIDFCTMYLPSTVWKPIISINGVNDNGSYIWNTNPEIDGTYPLRIRIENNGFLSEEWKLITIDNLKGRIGIVYEGMNLLSPPLIPSHPGTSHAVLSEFYRYASWQSIISVRRWNHTTSDFDITTIDKYGNIIGPDIQFRLGEAYYFEFEDMVRKHFDVYWRGNSFIEPPPLDLKAGINFVGFPCPANTYTSYELLDMIPGCKSISWYDPQIGLSAVSRNIPSSCEPGEKDGPDFLIELGKGYVVDVEYDVVWTNESISG